MSANSRNLFHNLPPPAECCAIIIGALELIPFGIAALRNPVTFSDGYGLPISNPQNNIATTRHPSSSDGLFAEANDNISTSPLQGLPTPESEETKKALVAAIAARNVQNGILLLTFGLVLRDRRSLGIAVLAGLVTTAADTVIVRTYGVKDKIAGHYVGIFNSLAVGGSLLYWGKNDPLW
ncbi:Nn.00g025660.m01.CDS01 [Neocucurbitaria sp. VM-36]